LENDNIWIDNPVLDHSFLYYFERIEGNSVILTKHDLHTQMVERYDFGIKKLKNNLALVEKEKMVPDAITTLLTYEELQEQLETRTLVYIEKQDSPNKLATEKYKFSYREVNYYKSEIENLIEDLQKAINEKKKIYILVSTKEKAKVEVEVWACSSAG